MKPGDPSYPMPSSAAASNVMRGNRKTGSRPEASLRRELHARGLMYRKKPSLRTSVGVVRPDLTLPDRRSRSSWTAASGTPARFTGPRRARTATTWQPKLRRNRERDRQVTAALIAEGWVVVRVWEHEPLEGAATAVETAVKTGAAQAS